MTSTATQGFKADGTLTVSCDNVDLDGDGVADPITADDVARGVVQRDTVSDTDQANLASG